MFVMELTPEEENFIKVSKLFLEVVPDQLRKLFVDKWNHKYKNEKWQSDSISGKFLFGELPNAVKNDKRNKFYVENMKTGNEKGWDTATLAFALLYSQLNLIEGCRPKNQRIIPLQTSEEIDAILGTRNDFFAHITSMQCSSAIFTDITSRIRNIAKNIFDANVENEIDAIVQSHITPKMAAQLKNQLVIEKNHNYEFVKAIKELKNVEEVKVDVEEVKDDVEEVKDDVEEMESDLEIVGGRLEVVRDNDEDVKDRVKNLESIKKGAHHPLKPYTQQDVDDLKYKYKCLYQKHQIHMADKDGIIKLEEVNIGDFAVKLKIPKDRNSVVSFRDERRNYLESLKSMTGDDIELSQLLDDSNRVTFIRGIAGLGKSMLSKQLVTSWSSEELFNGIKLCIFFECREINVFQGTAGTHVQKHEMLEEFVKTKFQFDLNDGKDVLFVIDGLDELFDISTDCSIIRQLLSRNIYPASKLIVTGRPHVERKLEECGEIGGLRRVEIQGLSDEQIEEYVTKFPFPKGVSVDLNSAKDASKRFIPILRIPQFLNNFCSIASLLKGEGIRNGTELYCWTIYLLLKQQEDTKNQNKGKSIPDIFHEYSRVLLTLGEVCYKLLNENKVIICRKEIEALIADCECGSDFIGNLFVDVSDSFDQMLQFKHLTVMEFLSAFYLCSGKNPLEIITDNLRNGCIEVVIFICQLISGINSRGIIQQMVKINAATLKQVSGSIFCHNVIKALKGCNLDEKTTFLASIDIIVSFLNEHCWDKSTVLVTAQMLSTENALAQGFDSQQWLKGIFLFVEDSWKLYTIYKHMATICKCTQDEVQVAFAHIHVWWFRINMLDMIECIKCCGYVRGIELIDMELSVNAIRHELETVCSGSCKIVNMLRCELEDNEIDTQSYCSNMDLVVIEKCKLKEVSSLINAFQWLTSSSSSSPSSSSSSSGKWFSLLGLEMNDGCWSALVIAIEKEKLTNGKIDLQTLLISNCTPKISNDLQLKILECGIELWIDGNWVHLEDVPRGQSPTPCPSHPDPCQPASDPSLQYSLPAPASSRSYGCILL